MNRRDLVKKAVVTIPAAAVLANVRKTYAKNDPDFLAEISPAATASGEKREVGAS